MIKETKVPASKLNNQELKARAKLAKALGYHDGVSLVDLLNGAAEEMRQLNAALTKKEKLISRIYHIAVGA